MTYIEKMERVLHFMKKFNTLGLHLIKQRNGSMELMITDNIMISEVFYEKDTLTLLYCSEKNPSSGISIDHVFKLYLNSYYNEIDDTFHECSEHRSFLLFNKDSNVVEFTKGHSNEISIEIPDIDLQSEEGSFQFSLLHEGYIHDIMQTVQYFQRTGSDSFSHWYHKDFDKIYEELNDTFGIG